MLFARSNRDLMEAQFTTSVTSWYCQSLRTSAVSDDMCGRSIASYLEDHLLLQHALSRVASPVSVGHAELDLSCTLDSYQLQYYQYTIERRYMLSHDIDPGRRQSHSVRSHPQTRHISPMHGDSIRVATALDHLVQFMDADSTTISGSSSNLNVALQLGRRLRIIVMSLCFRAQIGSMLPPYISTLVKVLEKIIRDLNTTLVSEPDIESYLTILSPLLGKPFQKSLLPLPMKIGEKIDTKEPGSDDNEDSRDQQSPDMMSQVRASIWQEPSVSLYPYIT